MTDSALKKHLAKIGAKGGKARGPSKARASEAMRRAALKRWGKAKRKPPKS